MDLVVPELGGVITEGVLTGWRKEVGAEVAAGEPIADVESDKSNFEVVAPAAGRLVERRCPAGATVRPGEVIGRIDQVFRD